MAHLAPPKNCPETSNIVQSKKVKLFNPNTKKCVLMAHLKDDKSEMFLISAERAFQSGDPATEKALSPDFVLVRGMSYSVVIAERS